MIWLIVAKGVRDKEILKRKERHKPVGTFICCLSKIVVWHGCWLFGIVSMYYRLFSAICAILINFLIEICHLQYLTIQPLSA